MNLCLFKMKIFARKDEGSYHHHIYYTNIEQQSKDQKMKLNVYQISMINIQSIMFIRINTKFALHYILMF